MVPSYFEAKKLLTKFENSWNGLFLVGMYVQEQKILYEKLKSFILKTNQKVRQCSNFT